MCLRTKLSIDRNGQRLAIGPAPHMRAACRDSPSLLASRHAARLHLVAQSLSNKLVGGAMASQALSSPRQLILEHVEDALVLAFHGSEGAVRQRLCGDGQALLGRLEVSRRELLMDGLFSARSVVSFFIQFSAPSVSLACVFVYMARSAPAAANVAAGADLGDVHVAMLDGNTIKVFWPQTRDDGVTKMRERLGTV